MYKLLQDIKKEHILLKKILRELESKIDSEEITKSEIMVFLKKFKSFWDNHEKKEDILFAKLKENNLASPTEIMLLEQHKQLRGHWKVLMDALKSKTNFLVALDTDGRMLIGKFRKHIEIEDRYFDALIKLSSI